MLRISSLHMTTTNASFEHAARYADYTHEADKETASIRFIRQIRLEIFFCKTSLGGDE